jgi:hypothetical protein
VVFQLKGTSTSSIIVVFISTHNVTHTKAKFKGRRT